MRYPDAPNYRCLATVFIVLLTIHGCAAGRQTRHYQYPEYPATRIQEKIIAEAESWFGTPHRLGGTSKKGIDCSGLVMTIYKNALNITLPRSTKEQATVGRPVKKTGLLPGDLIFFKTGFKKRHVGVYFGDNTFVHASASKGVIISNLDNPYWQKAYRKARRIF